MTKREDLVFKMIHTGLIEKPETQDTEGTQKQPKYEKPTKTAASHKVTCESDKRIAQKKAYPKHSSTPKGASPKRKDQRAMLVRKREKENGASPAGNRSSLKKRNELRARSITPGAGDPRRSLQNSRTPVSRRHK